LTQYFQIVIRTYVGLDDSLITIFSTESLDTMTRNEKEWVSHQPKSYIMYKVKVLILNEKKEVEGGGGGCLAARRLLGGSVVAAAARGRRLR
jgi:hypothetical protein